MEPVNIFWFRRDLRLKDNGEFDRWYKGGTGYPIVDAGMRELNETDLCIIVYA